MLVIAARHAAAQSPPTLDVVFPASGQVDQSVDVIVAGTVAQPGLSLQSSIPGLRCEPVEPPTRFRLSIPPNTPTGTYDVWAVSDQGISSPRSFLVGNRAEQLETEPNDNAAAAMSVPIDSAINGRIDKAGDQDLFRFEAKRGQRVVVECRADRIDSRLRAVLELFDATGRRLAVNHGYFGVDPLIDFHVPEDGSYVVKVHDLTSSGSATHYYRLDIDTGPRVAFCVPAIVELGKASRVTLYGWNLGDPQDRTAPAHDMSVFDRVDVELPASMAKAAWPLPVRSGPASAVLEGFAYHLPGSHASVPIGVSDVAVTLDRQDNHSPATAQLLAIPCELSGQLVQQGERDWYAIDVRRGEVLYLEGLAQRLNSPVDLEISVLNAAGERELARFSDEVRNIGGNSFPTNHLDPTGRWVAPSDGQFLIAVRNLSGGVEPDPRRVYRLSVRREEPDFQLVAVPRSNASTALNVPRGGRELVDVLAFRRRGCEGQIRITASALPQGIECADVWLGPGVDRGTVVVSADRNAPNYFGELELQGFAEDVDRSQRSPCASTKETVDIAKVSGDSPRTGRTARAGTVVRSGTPTGWGRLTSRIAMAVTGDAPLRITANAHEPLEHQLYGTLRVSHSPGGMLDVAVEVERRDTDHRAPVRLLGVGLPESIRNQTATIPAGEQRGHLSFYLPPTLRMGQYSFVIQAETTIPNPQKKGEYTNVTVYSNPVTFCVQPAAFLVEADPNAPTRARRGETIQIRYSAHRQYGFIGKMHTELAVPGRVTNVPGLRGRGETFVGQTEAGSLQIVVNDDAPLGPQPFLRLFTVGVVEDQPVYFGSCPLTLEIVE